MSALTEDRNTPFVDAELLVLPVAAASEIFAGSLVVVDANGYAAPGSTATGLVAMGMAEVHIDNSAGGNGDADVTVRRGKAFRFDNDGSISQANVGRSAYIVDDQTVAATDGTGTRSLAGSIIYVDADGVWVYIG